MNLFFKEIGWFLLIIITGGVQFTTLYIIFCNIFIGQICSIFVSPNTMFYTFQSRRRVYDNNQRKFKLEYSCYFCLYYHPLLDWLTRFKKISWLWTILRYQKLIWSKIKSKLFIELKALLWNSSPTCIERQWYLVA